MKCLLKSTFFGLKKSKKFFFVIKTNIKKILFAMIQIHFSNEFSLLVHCVIEKGSRINFAFEIFPNSPLQIPNHAYQNHLQFYFSASHSSKEIVFED